jgi:hypothetical protein
VRRHLRIRLVDLRIIEASLEDGGFGVVRHDRLRNTTNGGQRTDVGVEPVRQRLRPARVRKREARRAEHGHEDLRHPDFAGEPIDDDRHAVARVVDEQSLPRRMRLPHRRRQRLLECSIELTKTAVAISARMGGDVFVPDDLQRDVLALQLAVNRRPVRLSYAGKWVMTV